MLLFGNLLFSLVYLSFQFRLLLFVCWLFVSKFQKLFHVISINIFCFCIPARICRQSFRNYGIQIRVFSCKFVSIPNDIVLNFWSMFAFRPGSPYHKSGIMVSRSGPGSCFFVIIFNVVLFICWSNCKLKFSMLSNRNSNNSNHRNENNNKHKQT